MSYINEPAAGRQKLLAWEWGSPGMLSSIGTGTQPNPQAGKAVTLPTPPKIKIYSYIYKRKKKSTGVVMKKLYVV